MTPQRLMFIAFLARWFTTGDDADFELAVPMFNRKLPWETICTDILRALQDSGQAADGRDRNWADKLCRHIWRAAIFKDQRQRHLTRAKHHIL